MVNHEWLKRLSSVPFEMNGPEECVVVTNSIGDVKIRWVESGTVFKLHGNIAFQRAIKRDFHCKSLADGGFLFDKSMWPNVAKWILAAMQQSLKQNKLSKARGNLKKLSEKLKCVSKTEINSEGQRRNGQELLREFLLIERGHCEVSDVKIPELLVASHIKPWEDCVDGGSERLDTENVLLLAANWDALFDKKYISFDPETGKMMKAARIDDETLRKFGVPDDWRENVRIPVRTQRRKEYLRWHNRLMKEEDAKVTRRD